METSLFQVLSRDREQITKVHKDLSTHAHEMSEWRMLRSPEKYVTFQVTNDLVITKD